MLKESRFVTGFSGARISPWTLTTSVMNCNSRML